MSKKNVTMKKTNSVQQKSENAAAGFVKTNARKDREKMVLKVCNTQL
jgi:hypothetical protein